MKKYSTLWLLAIATAMTFTSCKVIGDIFKAGMWVGILIVVVVIVLILWLVGKSRN